MMIQHNLTAMNAQRMFQINEKKKAVVTERLSSGYRINRAADDAAGLAISEKMRRQIRGLSQAAENAQDGISMVQIADGAMAEVHDMLQRGTELCVKAANGTLMDEDRAYIQEEIKQIKEEIDGISDRTTFNEIQVLKGKNVQYIDEASNVVIQGDMPEFVEMTSTGSLSEEYTTTQNYKITDASGSTTTGKKDIKHSAATLDFSKFTGTDQQIKELVGSGFYTTCCTCDNHYSIRFTDDTTNSTETSGNHYIYSIGIKGVTNADDLLNRIIEGTNKGNPSGHYTMLVADTMTKTLTVYDDRSSESDPLTSSGTVQWIDWKYPYFNTKATGSRGKFGPGTAYSLDDPDKLRSPDVISLQIGAESGQHLDIELPSISCTTLGIQRTNVSTTAGADSGIQSFKRAIRYVSQERSRMGAYQNRLEHTIRNLDNVVENTQAAESSMRDTDMAETMVAYSNHNILSQAGSSILAQANQSSQGILTLLG